MTGRREFEIAFVGLKPGVHEFDYEIGDRFFEDFPAQDFSHCEAQVKLFLDKLQGLMILRFVVTGKLEVVCDRCGNPLPLDLWDEFRVLVKLVEEPDLMNAEGEDPDVYYISRTESHLHVSDWIFEFINLSIPTQRMCSDDQVGGPQCNPVVLEMLKKMNDEAVRAANPLWKDLEQFRGSE